MQLSLLKREYPKGEGVICVQLNVELLRRQPPKAIELDDGLAVLLGGDKSPAVANIARPQCPLQEEEFLKTFSYEQRRTLVLVFHFKT